MDNGECIGQGRLMSYFGVAIVTASVVVLVQSCIIL